VRQRAEELIPYLKPAFDLAQPGFAGYVVGPVDVELQSEHLEFFLCGGHGPEPLCLRGARPVVVDVTSRNRLH